MKFGLCPLSVVPLRSEPSHRSEMVNQMLFGEACSVVDEQDEWLRIRLAHDGYEGWLLRVQLLPLDEDAYHEYCSVQPALVGDTVELLEHESRATKARVLLAGSYLPGYDAASGRVTLGTQTYFFNGRLAEPARSREELLLQAYLFLNAPYQWGGRSLFGLDCSGFTQMVYRLAGVSLLRDASQQATQGETLSFLEESLPGDLAFFDNDEGRITHVGILVRPDQIIHCSGQVRLDGIDQHGIYNFELRKHTHRLRLIKSVVSLPV